MSNSIPISGLNQRGYMTKSDFFAFVDSSSLTTLRTSVNVLNDFFSVSGAVLSSSWSSGSISSSYALNSDTASYLFPRLYNMTASWAQNVVWGNVVGTSSLSYHALTASHLGGVNTSYETSMIINNNLSTTSSAYVEVQNRSNMISVGVPAIKQRSLFLNKDYVPGTSNYGKIYFFEDNTNTRGKVVFEFGGEYSPVNSIGPDIDSIAANKKGFLFQTNECGNTNGLQRTGSLMFISGSGRTYARIFEAQEFSSSLNSTNQVGFYGTASYALVANYSLGASNVIPTGMIVAYAGSTPPPSWLNCDGTVYNTSSYSALTALIGTNYGKSQVISQYVVPETVSTYHDASNGSITVTFTSGGSGVFRINWFGTNYYINAQTANSWGVGGLHGPQTYTYYIYDYGFSPEVQYTVSATVPYGGGAATYPSTISSATYRLPRMSSNYFLTYASLNPLIWIIKT